MSIAHRIWFGVALFASFSCIFLIPPFQSNDEVAHWFRAWSATSIVCRKIPSAAVALPEAVEYAALRNHDARLTRAQLRSGLELPGQPAQRDAAAVRATCMYSPVAYLLPSLAMHAIATPYDSGKRSGMLPAFYAARAVNWLLMTIGVLLCLLYVPGARNLTLLIYSLPMNLQQTVSINQDGMIFFLMFVILVLWWAKPSVRNVGLMIGALGAIALTKVVYLSLLPIGALLLVRLKKTQPDRARAAQTWLALSLILPVALCAAWNYLVAMPGQNTYMSGNGHAGEQIHFLLTHPEKILSLTWGQLKDFFGRGHMNGGWTGILGILGWADIELSNRAYLSLAAAIVVAFLGDAATFAPDIESTGSVRWDRWIRWLPIACVLVMVPEICFFTYLTFSEVGSKYVIGVHGRYFDSVYFPALIFIVYRVRARAGKRPLLEGLQRHQNKLTVLAMLLCGFAFAEMVSTLWITYLRP